MVMAEIGRCAFTAQLDIDHILKEAQHRWLRPPEICEILQNYKKIQIALELPNRPPSGTVFLFDRNVLRHFRKDGHNWRKNKDGRTAKEAHERLKSGSVDVLHCYYSYGEVNENIQRRSYWMLEEELSHIAFVHYLEVKAHVRGHQVRKKYKAISWSIGILEKVILRWRRKGSGLSGFKPEAPAASPSMVDAVVKEYDYDFLKEGRKQNEQRMQEALTRVKSMVQYPEARAQYQRIVSEMRNKKAAQDNILNNPEFNFDILIDFETFFDEDTHMLMAP